MFYLIASVIGLLVAGFVLSPLWLEHRLWSRLVVPEGRALLEDQRDVLLRDLKDLEFDQRMGKVDEADYTELRAALVENISAVFDELEKASRTARGGSVLDLEIEVEVLIARARLSMQLLDAVWQCVCGRQMPDADKFCASCGAPRPQAA